MEEHLSSYDHHHTKVRGSSFDIQLSHDFSGNESKNLKRTYATLIFKISEVDGTTRTRTLEVNLDELK